MLCLRQSAKAALRAAKSIKDRSSPEFDICIMASITRLTFAASLPVTKSIRT